MQKNWVKNFDDLASTENRKLALEIVSAGFDAIDTKRVIFHSVKLDKDILRIQDKSFSLNNFKKIKVVGFGKAAPEAAFALERILEDKIKEGAVIGLRKVDSRYIHTFIGTHPKPSEVNVEAGEKIYQIIQDSKEDDLIIVLVSGGGSALLCRDNDECAQGIRLYDSFLKSGKTMFQSIVDAIYNLII